MKVLLRLQSYNFNDSKKHVSTWWQVFSQSIQNLAHRGASAFNLRCYFHIPFGPMWRKLLDHETLFLILAQRLLTNKQKLSFFSRRNVISEWWESRAYGTNDKQRFSDSRNRKHANVLTSFLDPRGRWSQLPVILFHAEVGDMPTGLLLHSRADGSHMAPG